MESGSRWPSWLDRKRLTPTSVEVVSQQPGETARIFAQRAVHRILELEEAPPIGILVCNAHSGAERMKLRAALLRALVSRAQTAGRGQVVLAADGDYGQRSDLLRLAARLNEDVEQDPGVTVLYRALARQLRVSERVSQVA